MARLTRAKRSRSFVADRCHAKSGCQQPHSVPTYPRADGQGHAAASPVAALRSRLLQAGCRSFCPPDVG